MANLLAKGMEERGNEKLAEILLNIKDFCDGCPLRKNECDARCDLYEYRDGEYKK